MTFEQLKPRLVNILMNAVRIETDAQNTHMLLGGLLLCVQDAVFFEKSVESGADSFHQSSPGHSDGNLLSSGELKWEMDLSPEVISLEQRCHLNAYLQNGQSV